MNNLECYFEEYSAACLSFDPNALLAFFYQPCIVSDFSGVHLIDSDQAILDYERPFLEQLKANDISTIHSELGHSSLSEGPSNALRCSVAYDLRDSKGRTLLDFDYHYELLKQDCTYRILFAQIGKVRLSRLSA